MSAALSPENSSVRGIPLSVDFTHPEDYFIYIFQIVFATSSSLLAGSVVIAILKTKALRMQNRFIFMLNTSISDTFTGLSVFYLGLFDVQEGFPSRNGTFYILPSLLGVNILTFMFAQFDRYCAICNPFFYNRFISRSVVIGACIYIWFHSYLFLVATTVVPLSIAAQTRTFASAILMIVLLTKVIMTIKLYVVAHYQIKRDPPGPERDSKKESLQIIIVVVASFLLLWMPSFVNMILKQVTKYGISFRNEATNLFACMARFNAFSTPAFYVWGSPALRRAVLHIGWHKIIPRRTRTNTDRKVAKVWDVTKLHIEFITANHFSLCKV